MIGDCSRGGATLVCLLGLITGCSEDGGLDDAASDVGVNPAFDAEVEDSGRRDTGFPDSGFQGIPDAGFADPSILRQGREEVGRASLHVSVRGTLTSTMPPLVVLPTGPMHGHEYLLEPTEFLLGSGGVANPDRLIVYLDPRATGQSSFGALGEAGVTVENHIRDVENLVLFIDNLLGTTAPVDFLGHGYGAGLAALYAARNPQRVSRLVLSNPFPVNNQDYARWNSDFRAQLTGSDNVELDRIFRFQICFGDIGLCSLEYWRIIGRTWICEENIDILRAMRFEHLEFRTLEFFIRRDLLGDENKPPYDWSVELGRIPNIPTTIISGPCDPIPASSPLTYTASIAGARHHIVPGSGHFTITEQRAAFERIVKRALTY